MIPKVVQTVAGEIRECIALAPEHTGAVEANAQRHTKQMLNASIIRANYKRCAGMASGESDAAKGRKELAEQLIESPGSKTRRHTSLSEAFIPAALSVHVHKTASVLTVRHGTAVDLCTVQQHRTTVLAVPCSILTSTVMSTFCSAPGLRRQRHIYSASEGTRILVTISQWTLQLGPPVDTRP